jgi:hypothetical protein
MKKFGIYELSLVILVIVGIIALYGAIASVYISTTSIYRMSVYYFDSYTQDNNGITFINKMPFNNEKITIIGCPIIEKLR